MVLHALHGCRRLSHIPSQQFSQKRPSTWRVPSHIRTVSPVSFFHLSLSLYFFFRPIHPCVGYSRTDVHLARLSYLCFVQETSAYFYLATRDTVDVSSLYTSEDSGCQPVRHSPRLKGVRPLSLMKTPLMARRDLNPHLSENRASK